MSTSTQVCDVVLPGYTLIDRIGSGGYADVWRAEAPGGIQKAVKVVHGYYDDEFASQELKALERVKGVRHPFLLSLERFEVVNGRLAILTELADMSLDERRRQCCADGLRGIPRDELLHYLADAAEALDFLSQRHGLLHLDVKPENLLILGDHIKVADFGLVKELATRTQNSLVSGLTPTYASPEMFDDEPSAQSDQYSLAIVYQQMLVGTLPFPGRTVAQLAKQHTQAEPQLMSLPAEDRPIIARALAKKPTERFPSCLAFVDALARRADQLPAATPVEVPLPRPKPTSPATPAPDDTKPPSFCTTLRREELRAPVAASAPAAPAEAAVTQPVRRGITHDESPPPEPATAHTPREEIIDVAVPEVNPELGRKQPTLYIAVGGIGIQVLCRLRAQAADSWPNADAAVEAIALDTDRNELREACSKRWKLPLETDDTLHIPLRLPKDYDDSRDILRWVSRRWLYNIPRSLETRGYRPLGRLALVDQAPRVLATIDKKLARLANMAGAIESPGHTPDSTVRIVILSGTGGGTGAGSVIDLANAVREQAAKRNCVVEIQAFLVCPNFAGNGTSPLTAANTYALLTELNHAMVHGNQSVEASLARHPFESRGAPFDSVYWLPTRPKICAAEPLDSLDAVVKRLALEQEPNAAAVFRTCRMSRTPREESPGRSFSLRTFGIASLTERQRQFTRRLAVDFAAAIKQYWLTEDASENWGQLIQEEQARNVPKPSAQADNAVNSSVAAPATEVTSLALRARFKEHLTLQFTSEVLRQIQRQLARRDERGRPMILANDAKLIADIAAVAVPIITKQNENAPTASSKIADSSELRPFIVEGSRRVLETAVENIDLRQRDHFLTAESINQLLENECQKLLAEKCDQPEFLSALTAMLDVDQMLAETIEESTTNLLQCGADRRTLLFVPKHKEEQLGNEAWRASRPHVSVHSADVDGVVAVSENSGVSPRSFALGLIRVFPGVADAACRLHTRIDIEWRSLL